MLKRTTIYLDTADLKALAKVAKAMDRPLAWVIRYAIKELLKRDCQWQLK
jgi:predicted transcriptional regulator